MKNHLHHPFHLVIVRHATAEDKAAKQDDSDRKLTSQGRKEAKQSAKACKAIQFPKPHLILTSGFKRANETLKEFAFSKKIDVKETKNMEPSGDVTKAIAEIQSFLSASPKKKHKTVWVFGHQPHLGKLIRKLAPELSQCLEDFPKSGVVWLSWAQIDKNGGGAVLRGYMPQPSL